ncbi:MAG: hypothetical protein U0354_12005 [Candidatus Sericytochromatia bacterium]
MSNILGFISKGLQLSGMLSMPFAIYYGETEKSMSIELNYLLIGAALFILGFIIENNFVKG